MPSEYQLKRDPFSTNRIRKIGKQIIQTAEEDRKLALDTYAYFKEQAEDGKPSAFKYMADCLKLAQTAQTNMIKVLALLSKDGGGDNSNDDGEMKQFNFEEINSKLS